VEELGEVEVLGEVEKLGEVEVIALGPGASVTRP
jgi:hypothetical protein